MKILDICSVKNFTMQSKDSKQCGFMGKSNCWAIEIVVN
jgi:hypothetical protein